MIISVPLSKVSSISIVSPRVFHILIFFLIIPVWVYIDISHSHSAIIDITSSGRINEFSPCITEFGVKLIVALFQIYGCHSGTAIRIVERRLEFATLERALITPVNTFSSTETCTFCHTVRVETRLGSTSIIICGCFPVKSAI